MTKKIYRIAYLGYGSRVLESTLVEWRPSGRGRKMRSHITNCKHEAESKCWEWGEAREPQRSTPGMCVLQYGHIS